MNPKPEMALKKFKSVAEERIAEAMADGVFQSSASAGKPIAGIEKPYDPMWWVKEFIEREKVSVLPESMRIRREAEDEIERIMSLASESEARAAIAGLNGRIARANSRSAAGPATTLAPFDADELLGRWRNVRGKHGR